jgi:3-phenylpropionate/cinnamic acid dioxygenase small subunit
MAPDLERIADKLEITDVLYRYATALDQRDWALLAEVFAPEAVYTMGARGDFTGPEAIGAKIASLIGGYESTQHMITNPVIEINGDAARASCYLHGQHYMPDQRTGGNTYEMGGTYRDELARTAAGWRITRRVLEVAWREGNAAISAEAQERYADSSGERELTNSGRRAAGPAR